MNRIIAVCLVGFSLCSITSAHSQVRAYTEANAHSHNDYEKPTPFYTAFQNGFGSIEADVFAVDGKLCVAHSAKEIKKEATLERLYIQPLLKEFKSGKARQLNLLIDIKDDYAVTLPLIVKEFAPLKNYLSTSKIKKYVTITISGNRPKPADYKNYPAFIFFDDDLKSAHNAEEWKRVSLVSLPFNKISAYKGTGAVDSVEVQKLKQVIDSAHQLSRPIRFWAAPDTKESWEWQIKLDVDFIGTDSIEQLAQFLRNRKTQTAKR